MTENAVISDTIVRKIQLLLVLAARTKGNEVEAAAAMGKAQELLAKYNLDLATVQDKVVDGGTPQQQADARRDYARVSRSAMYKWQRALVQAIAEANYCHYWVVDAREEAYVPPSKRKAWAMDEARQEIRVKRHKILGRTANTASVLIMVDYLMETIERLLPYPQSARLSRSANSWREGCADRLIERIKAKAEEMRTPDYATQGEAGYSTALAIRNLAKSEEIGNYDAIHGAGAWARMQTANVAWTAQWEANRPTREAAAAAQRAAEAQKLLAETPAQKAARERKEAVERRRSERYWDAQDRAKERAAARRDGTAYAAGKAKAETIGLSSQVPAGAGAKVLTE